ncbi:MAG TPA: DUF2339 domain-containing protein [Acidobacteriaceae bacterium]
MGADSESELRKEVAELRARLLRIEQALANSGMFAGPSQAAVHGATEAVATPGALPASPAWNPATSEAEAALARPQPPSVPAARNPPSPPPALPQWIPAAPRRNDDASLETRIGSQWFNRIGILAVLIGVAWFLKLAFDNHWIGPLGRVLIGLLAGAGLIAWSERFRSHGYAAFSWSLKAIASGVLYLSLWAAFSVYHLVPSPVAFAAMIVVTAFNGFLAWIQDAELLALYAIVGGFSTPALLSTGENHEVALFAYLLLLDLAVLVLVALRPWSRLLSGAFAGTALYVALWATEFYSTEAFGTTAFFIACFFLVFALAPRLVRLHDAENVSAWDYLAAIVLPLANAALGFLAFYLMLEDAADPGPEPWVAVAFAAFYLVLLRLPQRGVLHEDSPALAAVHLTVAVAFLTMAIPLKTHGRWLTIGWLVEAAALTWGSRRIASRLLRALAVLCLVLGLAALVLQNPSASTTPIFNQRFGAYCVGIAVCALVAWLAAHAPHDEQDHFAVLAWPMLAIGAALAVNALILLAVGWEIHSFWWYLQWRAGFEGDWRLAHDYRMYAQFTYSAFFMLLGAVLLGLGFWRRSAFLRWQALVLLALAIGKVFTVDVAALSQGYRILSFLGLGALLLAVSFVYQRDWLHLRASDSRTA